MDRALAHRISSLSVNVRSIDHNAKNVSVIPDARTRNNNKSQSHVQIPSWGSNAGVEPFFLLLLLPFASSCQYAESARRGGNDAHLALLSDRIIKADSLCFPLRRSLLVFFSSLSLLSPTLHAAYGARTIVKTTDEYTMKKARKIDDYPHWCLSTDSRRAMTTSNINNDRWLTHLWTSERRRRHSPVARHAKKEYGITSLC